MLRDDPRLGDAWVLAITVAAKGRMADSVLDAGADDYLHRPFTRAELIARARAGLRAAQQRANDRLLRTLMENVPGAIYRSAWHADYVLEMISDEIERISGYPPAELPRLAASARSSRIVHPDDVDVVLETVAHSRRAATSRSCSSTGSCAPTARCAGCSTAASSCPGPAGGCGWTARCSTSPSAARPRRRCCATRSRRRAPPSCAPRAQRILEAADEARRKIERDLHDGAQQRLVSLVLDVQVARRRLAKDPSRGRARSSSGSGNELRRPRPSCASSPAASTRRC